LGLERKVFGPISSLFKVPIDFYKKGQQ